MTVVQELSEAVGRSTPLVKAIEKGSPLATAEVGTWKCSKWKQFYKEHVRVVEPIEFILDQKSQYIYQFCLLFSCYLVAVTF